MDLNMAGAVFDAATLVGLAVAIGLFALAHLFFLIAFARRASASVLGAGSIAATFVAILVGGGLGWLGMVETAAKFGAEQTWPWIVLAALGPAISCALSIHAVGVVLAGLALWRKAKA